MTDCPFNPSGFPCELEMDLMIQYEAERESLEVFYAMQEELRPCMNRIQILESILTANDIPIPEYDD